MTRPAQLAMLRWCAVGVRIAVVLLGATAAYASRYALNPDGTSYLDVSDVYLSGEWPASRTGYWSPLYPTLLAGARWVFSTAPEDAWIVAHGVNLALFLLALVALEFLVQTVCGAGAHSGRDQEAESVWTLLIYSTFAWIMLRGRVIEVVTPDLIVAAILLSAAAVSVRIVRGGHTMWRWICLGTLLGIGYLAKAAMLPLGVAMILSTSFACRRHRWHKQGIVAVMVLAVIALPQLWYVSSLSGRFAPIEVARLNRAWFVAGVPSPLWAESSARLPAELPDPYRDGQSVRTLDPERDVRPAAYHFDDPSVPGSFPLWYDPTHWYRNVPTQAALPKQLARTVYLGLWYGIVLAPFLLTMTALIIVRLWRGTEWEGWTTATEMVLPAVLGFGMYALVHVEERFIVAFVVLLLGGLVPPWAGSEWTRTLRRALTAVGCGLLLLAAGSSLTSWRERLPAERARYTSLLITADDLARRVPGGTKVGLIGNPYLSYWAQLAGVRLVGVVPGPEVVRFWAADPAGRQRVIDRLRRRGAQAVVAARWSAQAGNEWITVGSDSLLVYVGPQSNAIVRE